jgi:hypothetical protein
LVTLPISGTKSYGYYFSDGKLAVSTDQNGQASYQHYESALDRLAYSKFPDGGWSSRTYGSVVGYFYQNNVNTSLGHTAARYLCCRLLKKGGMMSAAKHLLFLIEDTQKQIPRSARDDIVRGSLRMYDRYGNMTCQTNSNTNGPCPKGSRQ